ncbi:MAG: gamma-glutamylcyclotransferase [Beijerinckiaceae bacterium]|nr:gamma-glutamylcyclotransferase [Beijerinckiaceae bacterium]MCZ8299042.1 gamma-glutamylcyclotransferase [Beijerinckiaceae bacterium]
MTSQPPIHLFSYGTLQLPQVQLSQFGRLLAGQPDILPGYRKAMVEIADPAVIAASGERFHPILLRTGLELDEVTGTVFQITAEELAAADAYEVSDYRRVAARLRSGLEAWVYVKA